MAATNSASLTNASAVVINPYSNVARQLRMEQQATNQVVADTMGIQLQRRERAVKKCKKRATKLLAKHKLSRQQAIDAGGVAFIAIEQHCTICKAKNLNARGIKTRIPKRSHHKAC